MTSTTKNIVPGNSSTFITDLQTFLREEDPDRFRDMFTGFIVSGGTHVTGAGLVHTPTSLTAYPGGHYITETGSITYPDSATHIWVICHKDTTTAVTDWTRVSGTHYLFRNTGSATLPALPVVESAILMKVTTSGGAVTVVDDQRIVSTTDALFGFVNLKESPFNALGDGSIDDSAAVTAVEALLTKNVYVPAGDYPTTRTNFNSFTKKYFGVGQLADTASKKLPFFFSHADARPSVLGSHGALAGAFDGDLSGSIFQVGHAWSNGSLGTPTTGFLFTNETSPFYTYVNVKSDDGFNNSTSDNVGRTGAVVHKTRGTHSGQGDLIAYNANMTVNATRAGATHFLANPAVSLYGGSVTSLVDDAAVVWGETNISDGGFKCRGSGPVINFTRNNDTAGLANFWSGIRLNSNGTKVCDAAYEVVGTWKNGLDLTPSTISGAGIVLAQSQKLEFDGIVFTNSAGIKQFASTLNNWDIQYTGTAMLFRAAGTNALQYNASQVTVTLPLVVNDAGGLNLSNASADLQIASTQVVTARQTGWSATTGSELRTNFGDASLADTSQALRALIVNLKTHGLIGT